MATQNAAPIKIIAENKKAWFDFTIGESFEAGLVLMGSEVKSLRAGQVNLKDSYISFQGHEAFLQNAHISEYKASSYNNHQPERLRKLLLKETELVKIQRGIQEKNQTCVPLKIYFKNGWIKLQIALAVGKKKGDKRESAKEKSVQKDLRNKMRKER